MAKLVLVPVAAALHRLVLVAGLYLALVVKVEATVAQPALLVDELLAHSVLRQLAVVC